METLQYLAPAIQKALDITTAAFAGVPRPAHARLLKKIIDDSDVCVGVFKDASHPMGWSTSVIKGQHLLEKIGKSDEALDVAFAAVPCRSLEEAVAMKLFAKSS
jgi:hypothetical protein